MTSEFLKDRERALEDQYFQQRDRELIAALRERGRRAREQSELRARLGDSDGSLSADLQAAGLTPDTLALLHLVPLVEVAWTEGGPDQPERTLILALAESRGVTAGSDGYARLVNWLETRPEPRFFERAHEAIRAILAQHDPKVREAEEHDLVARATRIAEATGGVFGIGAVSSEERECLRRIAEEIHADPGRSPDRP